MCRGMPIVSAGFQDEWPLFLLLQHLSGHGLLCVRSGDHCTFHQDDYAASYLECSSSPMFTSKDIWPVGHMVSPLNPMSDVVAGIIWLLIFGWSLTKQCSYRTSEDDPPSMYIWCTKFPPISASMIISPFVPSSSPKDGKEITVSGEKLWVTLYLAILSYG
ncbi:hypothetical protein Tco_0117075 [Tanacetum coccineum]